MTHEEIVQRYKQAEDKYRVVRAMARETNQSTGAIFQILRDEGALGVYKDIVVNKSVFSPQDDRTIRDMVSRGLSFEDIAAAVGRPANLCYAHYRVLQTCKTCKPSDTTPPKQKENIKGIEELMKDPTTKYTPEDEKQLMDLRAKGYTFDQISEIMGRSAKTLSAKYQKLLKAGTTKVTEVTELKEEKQSAVKEEVCSIKADVSDEKRAAKVTTVDMPEADHLFEACLNMLATKCPHPIKKVISQETVDFMTYVSVALKDKDGNSWEVSVTHTWE